MAETKKIAFTNLGDLRNDLRINQDELAKHMGITRQSVSDLEDGQAKGAIFMRNAFESLRESIGHGYQAFELESVDDSEHTFRIHYIKLKATSGAPEFDALSFQIMEINNKIRTAIRNDDGLLTIQERYLLELKETIETAYVSNVERFNRKAG